jgi:chorismate mutase
LRREIDALRKELLSAFNEVTNLKKNIGKTKTKAEVQNKEYIVGAKVAEEANN